jgi:hypothetical protein
MLMVKFQAPETIRNRKEEDAPCLPAYTSRFSSAENTNKGRKYYSRNAMDKTKLIKAGKSPIGIIVFHADHDWTRRARVTISTDNFSGMVNVGACIIALRV